MRRFEMLAAVSCLALAMPCEPLMAQAAPTPGAPTPADDQSHVEDVVVTAQRQEQRLQDVPISVVAVTSSQLAAKGVTNTQALQAAVPGLDTSKVGSIVAPYLRGVGSNAANPNNEPSVALYVDGVYIGAPFVNVFGFNNIERVEVLKGPQGTLFGRNATGGVIQVVTRQPQHDTSVEASVGYANYDTLSGSLYATTGLGEKAAIDFAGQYENQAHGWGHNVLLDIPTHKSREYSMRSKLLLEPTDTTKITLSGDYGYNRNSKSDYELAPGVIGVDGQPHYFGPHNTDTNVPAVDKAKEWGASFKLDQDLGFARLVNITARRIAHGKHGPYDSDGSSVDLIDANLTQRESNWSEEVQLINPVGSKINWLVGGFYYDANAGYKPGLLSGQAFGGTTIDINSNQHTKSGSIYGQTTIELFSDTKLTGGLRWTDEKQDFTGSVNGGDAPDQDQSFKKLTWRVALDHKLTQDVLAYVSYNRGVKSGGFDLLSPGRTGFKPEVLDAYEVGLKTQLFDHRLQFNTAAFLYNYKDIQVSGVDPAAGTTFTINAAKALIKGVDVDINAVPIPHLTINGGFSLLWGHYQDFPNPIVYPASPGGVPVMFPNNNAKGFDTIRTPRFTGNISATYGFDVGSGRISVIPSVSYNDGYYFDVDNRLRQSPYTLLNAALDWQSANGRFGVNVWGRNLGNKAYLSQGVPSGTGDLIVHAAPRTYGITLRTKL